MRGLLFFAILSLGTVAHAGDEFDSYGEVQLNGIARDNGSLEAPGLADVMVCNVNGSDKFLALRSGPGTQYETLRKINRLAIMRVDSEQRSGHWIYVTDIFRDHDTNGIALDDETDLNADGWVYDDYLCDFIINQQD